MTVSSFLWSRGQGNFALLRDSHALRLTSKLADLRAGNANLLAARSRLKKRQPRHKKGNRGQSLCFLFMVEVTGFVSARRRKGEKISPFLRASVSAGSDVPPARHSLPAFSNPVTLSVKIQKRKDRKSILSFCMVEVTGFEPAASTSRT